MERLREAQIGVESRGQRIPAMLYPDDMAILVMLRRAVNEMGEWCVEWSGKLMSINVG